MRPFPTTAAVIWTAVLAGMVVGGAEAMGAWYDRDARWPMYAGGIAGLAAAGLGLVFAVKLARLDLSDKESGAAFWKWWGAGMFSRFALIGGVGLALTAVFKKHAAPALLTMMGVYLIGLFAETAWLAKIFFNTGKK